MRNFLRADQMVAVRQFRYLHRPCRFKTEGPCSALTPPEIEMPVSLLRTLRDQIPVHEIVRRILVILGERPPVIRQHLVSEIKTKYSGNGRLTLTDGEESAPVGEFFLQPLE